MKKFGEGEAPFSAVVDIPEGDPQELSTMTDQLANSIYGELKNAVEAHGMTPTPTTSGDLMQLVKSMWSSTAAGQLFVDSGGANNKTLTHVRGASYKFKTSTANDAGFEIEFTNLVENTGPVVINIYDPNESANHFQSVPLTDGEGVQVQAGQIMAGDFVRARFNIAEARFELTGSGYSAKLNTSSVKRTQKDVNSERYHIKDFRSSGATWDAAIERAFGSGESAIDFGSFGDEYSLSDPHVVPAGMTLYGNFPLIRQTSPNTPVFIAPNDYVNLERLRYAGRRDDFTNSDSSIADAIQVTGSNVTVDRCEFDGFSHSACTAKNANDFTWLNNKIIGLDSEIPPDPQDGGRNYGLLVLTTSNGESNRIKIVGGSISKGGNGLRIEGHVSVVTAFGLTISGVIAQHGVYSGALVNDIQMALVNVLNSNLCNFKFQVDPAKGSNHGLTLSQCISRLSGSHGFLISAGDDLRFAERYYDVGLYGCRSYSATESGFELQNITGGDFAHLKSFDSGKSGIRYLAGDDLTFEHCETRRSGWRGFTDGKNSADTGANSRNIKVSDTNIFDPGQNTAENNDGLLFHATDGLDLTKIKTRSGDGKMANGIQIIGTLADKSIVDCEFDDANAPINIPIEPADTFRRFENNTTNREQMFYGYAPDMHHIDVAAMPVMEGSGNPDHRSVTLPKDAAVVRLDNSGTVPLRVSSINAHAALYRKVTLVASSNVMIGNGDNNILISGGDVLLEQGDSLELCCGVLYTSSGTRVFYWFGRK